LSSCRSSSHPSVNAQPSPFKIFHWWGE
jgi:hypothetical protein